MNTHKILISCLLLIQVCTHQIYAQEYGVEYFGFRKLNIQYINENVNILVKSKKGEENIQKPIFLFLQGSLPQPIIMLKKQPEYSPTLMPFFLELDTLLKDYHFAIISKPFIPPIEKVENLGQNYMYVDSTGNPPLGYQETYYPAYYVQRNLEVIDFLQKQSWVSKDKLVVAGHSEGSFLGAKIAFSSDKVTHLIYASGSPMGRILRSLAQVRKSDTDSTQYSEKIFDSWEKLANSKGQTGKYARDSEYYFSEPMVENILTLNIPVLVVYGTEDESAPFNDYLRIEAIRQKKNNITFKAYLGLEHNFFPVENGKINHDIFNWDKVFYNWCDWLEKN